MATCLKLRIFFLPALLGIALGLVTPIATAAGPKKSDVCTFLFEKVKDRKLKLLRWSEDASEFSDARLEKIFNFTNVERQVFGAVETGPAALRAFKKEFAKKYKHGEFFVVLEGNEVIGTAAMRVTPRTKLAGATGELQKLYLSKDLRGYGLGEKLLAATEDFARKQNVDRIRLETYSGMDGAQTLYEAKGYLVQGHFAEAVDAGTEVIQSPLVRGRQKLSPEEVKSLQSRFAKAVADQGDVKPAKVDVLYVYEKPLTVAGRRELLGEHFVNDLWTDPTFGGDYMHSLAKLEQKDPELFALFKEVGFEFKGGKLTRIPDQLEFIEKYDGVLARLKREGKDTPGKMVPVTVEKADGGFRPYPGLGYAKDVDFVKRVFVEDLSPANKRLPDAIFIAMFASGQTPLMNLHDIHHVLALAKNPELKSAIRAAYTSFAAKGKELSLVQNRVLGYALESLSLGNIKKRSAFTWANPNDVRLESGSLERAYAYFDAKVGKDPKSVVTAMVDLFKPFDDVFGAYSASANSIVEREYELRNFEAFWKGKDEAFLEAFSVERPRKYTEDLSLPRESFDEDPFYWPMRARRYYEIIGNRANSEAVRLRAVAELRSFIVRVAFFLDVTTRPGVLPPEKWMNLMAELAEGNTHLTEVAGMRKLYELGFGDQSVTYRMFFEQFAPMERGMTRGGGQTRGLGTTRGIADHRGTRKVITIPEEQNPDLPWR